MVNNSSTSVRAGAWLILALLWVAALLWARPDATDHQSSVTQGGFRDVLPTSGIDFRGGEHEAEKFKVNFYDHRSGLAVADFDGDGDVLFLNQLGETGCIAIAVMAPLKT